MPDASIGTGGDQAGKRTNRMEQQHRERMVMEKLYLEMAPELKKKGLTMREILSLENNAMVGLVTKHKEDDLAAVDTCYHFKKKNGMMHEFVAPRGWQPPEQLPEQPPKHAVTPPGVRTPQPAPPPPAPPPPHAPPAAP
eukprot:gene2701-24220_t